MSSLVFLKGSIFIGQKTMNMPSRFGEGHEYELSIGVRADTGFNAARAASGFKNLLAELDHKLIGLDVHIGRDPTPANLLMWIVDEVKIRLGIDLTELHMKRGDGLDVRYLAQP